MQFGYMVHSPRRLFDDSSTLLQEASFLEVPMHDKMSNMSQKELEHLYRVQGHYTGFVTLHGEGETDGKKRIMFSSPERAIRTEYTANVSALANTVANALGSRVRAVIVHPGRLDLRFPRRVQIQWLAESLSRLVDSLDIEVSIESRGCERHAKVLRAQPDDIMLLDEELRSTGCKATHCLDIAQVYVCYGMGGIKDTLSALRLRKIPLTEIHMSDVKRSEIGQLRISAPVGSGEIDWAHCLPHLLDFHARVLIEVIGGVRPFQRSMTFIQEILPEGVFECPITAR